MKIIVFGANGHLGKILLQAWAARGWQCVAVARHPLPQSLEGVKEVRWDGSTLGYWVTELEGSDAVVNLAGRSVDCRYHEQNRRAILESRVLSTRAVGAAIAHCAKPPPVWLQMSTATLYAHRFDAANDEYTGQVGGFEPTAPAAWNFSIEVAKAWEKALEDAATPHTRKVALRTAMVMAAEKGGAFARLRLLARLGFGGAHGNGKQYMSWIHSHDFVAAMDHLLSTPSLVGPVNLAAPEPLPNRDFQGELVRQLSPPFALPTPLWLLGLGTWLLRTESELILKSRRVISRKLPESGFRFRFSTWSDACANLLQNTPP